MAQRLSDRQREAIHGIHYGGMSLTPETVNRLPGRLPRAVHLAGYGNTLFGVVMEVADTARQALDYYPLGDRVQFHVVDSAQKDEIPLLPRRRCPPQTGRRGCASGTNPAESCSIASTRAACSWAWWNATRPSALRRARCISSWRRGGWIAEPAAAGSPGRTLAAGPVLIKED